MQKPPARYFAGESLLSLSSLLHFDAAKGPDISVVANPEADEFRSTFFNNLGSCYRKEIKALYDA
jgi:hypothetical protein